MRLKNKIPNITHFATTTTTTALTAVENEYPLLVM